MYENIHHTKICLIGVSAAPGNPENTEYLLEFDIPPGNTGNLLVVLENLMCPCYVLLFTLFSWCNIKLFMCLEYLCTVMMLFF